MYPKPDAMDATESPSLDRNVDTEQIYISQDLEPEYITVTAPQTLFLEVVFVFSMCMAAWMALNGLLISIVTGHIISHSSGFDSPGQVSWYAATYSFTIGTFSLISGRLVDLFGHKKLFIIGSGCHIYSAVSQSGL